MTYNNFFSHIYAEEGVWGYPAAQKIRAAFPNSYYIPIGHYKDVFCKKGQDFLTQKNSPKLILAIKRGQWHYSGSDMCDSFGRGNFIYTTEIRNCVYNCEYCYLRGMYQSANIVVFVNQEDCFRSIEPILPAYICVSYDSDILALEHLTGFTRGWLDFCRRRPDAEIEIRTKSAAFKFIEDIEPLSNVTLAWTISPDAAVSGFENGAPPLASRLGNIRDALGKGWDVRVCVDPVIKFNGWREAYRDMAEIVKRAVNIEQLAGISVGAFRVPADFYKRMRGLSPGSRLLAYPVVEKDGGMRYPDEEEIIQYVRSLFNKNNEKGLLQKPTYVILGLIRDPLILR